LNIVIVIVIYRDQIDILPFVMAMHCFGCRPDVMYFWHEIAEEYNFVLAIPHGIKRSFNAQNCCGDAMKQNIDDVGFLKGIITEMSTTFPQSVSPDIVYGVGWSNGGYMVTRAANLFRAIAPIAGFQVDLPILEKPVGLFMHHSETDQNVQINGCCTDPLAENCCCGLDDAVDQCTSAMTFFESFGKSVNHCKRGPNKILEMDGYQAVTCYEAGSHCKTNTTFCVHEQGGHFGSPSFEKSFPMSSDIANFFARDACSTDEGTWDPELKQCNCRASSINATYCLPGDWEKFEEINESVETLSIAVAVYWVILFVIGFLYCRKQRAKKGHSTMVGNDDDKFGLVSSLELTDPHEEQQDNAHIPLSKFL
jgi:poly(3-hydroxybutyrate) depolymerase